VVQHLAKGIKKLAVQS